MKGSNENKTERLKRIMKKLKLCSDYELKRIEKFINAITIRRE